MAMELRVDHLADDGNLPKDCYISVRVGETQKLSKLSTSRLYRFPQADGRRYGKIEVFRRIGQSSIDIDQSNEGTREVSINCQEAGFGILGLQVAVKADSKSANQQAEDADAKKRSSVEKVKHAKDYLLQHNLEMRLSEVMQAVLRERPENPAEFMGLKLLGTSSPGSPPVPPRYTKESQQPAEDGSLKAAAPPRSPALLQKAEPTALQKPGVLPFPKYYESHFKLVPGTLSCYSRFKSKAPAKAPAQPKRLLQHRPSVGTWLVHRRIQPEAAAPALTKAKPILQQRPSVGTWLMPLRKQPQPTRAPPMPAPKADRNVMLMPSVGTWIMPIPKRAVAQKQREESVLLLPSVGTWYQPIRKRRVQQEPKTAATTKEPAVPAALPTHSDPIFLAPQAFCGPAFIALGLNPGMLMFI